MNTKVCSNSDCQFAGQPQPLENFYKHRGHKDGYCSRCKSCEKAYRKTEQGKAISDKWNKSKKGRDAMHRYESSQHGRKHRKQYREQRKDFYQDWQYDYNRSDAGKQTVRKYQTNHREVYEGRKAIMRLIDRGIIPHPKDTLCSDCGKQATEYHHHNGYSAECLEDVIPVCFSCHKKRHRKYS